MDLVVAVPLAVAIQLTFVAGAPVRGVRRFVGVTACALLTGLWLVALRWIPTFAWLPTPVAWAAVGVTVVFPFQLLAGTAPEELATSRAGSYAAL